MAVVQLVNHLGTYVEQRSWRLCRIGLLAIPLPYRCPVFLHRVEEAVMFIYQSPQTVEIVATGVVIFRNIVASHQHPQQGYKQQETFHQ